MMTEAFFNINFTTSANGISDIDKKIQELNSQLKETEEQIKSTQAQINNLNINQKGNLLSATVPFDETKNEID